MPYRAKCRDTAALAAHIQRHGSQYTLAHVAAGLQVLTALVPTAPAAAGASANGSAEGVGASAEASISPISSSYTNTTTVCMGKRVAASAAKPAAAASPPRPSVAQCAQRLALLGRDAMQQEGDMVALAECLGALWWLAREAACDAELAVPFLLQLREPGHFHSMLSQKSEVLVALLHAMGEAPRSRQQLDSEAFYTLLEVVKRLVMVLTRQAAYMSDVDAALAARALARLDGGIVRTTETHLRLMQLLAHHVATRLAPRAAVSPEAAVMLLLAYDRLLRGACAVPDGNAAAAESSGMRSEAGGQAAAATAAAAKGVAAAAAAGSKGAVSARARDRKWVEPVVQFARRAVRLMPPTMVVELVAAVGRLGTREELGLLMQQATPALLNSLYSLDNAALADVLHALHSLGVKEPGLLAATGNQIVASGAPLGPRDAARLALAFGVGGSAKHGALWAVVRRSLADQLDTVRDLPRILPALNRKDPEDAKLAKKIEARIKELKAQRATLDARSA